MRADFLTILLFSTDGRHVIVVQLLRVSLRNIVQRISSHVLPCRRTTNSRLHPVFSDSGNFPVAVWSCGSSVLSRAAQW